MPYLYKEKLSGWNWVDVESVTSTNDKIKELVLSETKIVLSAKHQTSGRGRRGRVWQEFAGNLYFTYTENILPNELSKIVCLVGLSLAETVLSISPKSDVKIKWPNDIYLNGSKLSGILIENISGSLWAIGVGVNIVSSPILKDAGYTATSLKQNGITLDRTDFLRYYLSKFADIMQEYRTNGFSQLKQRWIKFAMNYQKEISVKQENTIKKGTFTMLDDNGYLILSTASGNERIVAGDLFINEGTNNNERF